MAKAAMIGQRDVKRNRAALAVVALDQDLPVVVDQVRARPQRHRRLQHRHLIVGRGDEGHPHRKGHDEDAQNEHEMAEESHEGPVLDHQ
jgi:hypothetical protein